jgi:hypothetical protein
MPEAWSLHGLLSLEVLVGTFSTISQLREHVGFAEFTGRTACLPGSSLRLSLNVTRDRVSGAKSLSLRAPMSAKPFRVLS